MMAIQAVATATHKSHAKQRENTQTNLQVISVEQPWDLEDVQAYLEWLREETGENSYRLPSEAEWEYAARAGTADRNFWGENADDGCTYANGADQTMKLEQPEWTVMACDDGYLRTAPVGNYQPNRFGLHDMIGNLGELVRDNWFDNYENAPSDGSPRLRLKEKEYFYFKVLRGGSWIDAPRNLRSANRELSNGSRKSSYGFRVAKTLTP